jgi:hypothetical protein
VHASIYQHYLAAREKAQKLGLEMNNAGQTTESYASNSWTIENLPEKLDRKREFDQIKGKQSSLRQKHLQKKQ